MRRGFSNCLTSPDLATNMLKNLVAIMKDVGLLVVFFFQSATMGMRCLPAAGLSLGYLSILNVPLQPVIAPRVCLAQLIGCFFGIGVAEKSLHIDLFAGALKHDAQLAWFCTWAQYINKDISVRLRIK